jgi:hypothetical protein
VYLARDYRAFDELVEQIRRWAAWSVPDVSGYRRTAVASRLVQRVTEIGFRPFLAERRRARASGRAGVMDPAGTMRFGGLVVDPSDGNTGPDWRTLLKSLAVFGRRWLEAAAVCARGVLRRGKGPEQRGTLLLAMGMSAVAVRGDDRRFVEFCRRGPIAPLRDASRLVVETTSGLLVSTEPEWVEYTTNPLCALARAQHWRPGEFLRFLAEHVRALVAYVVAVARCRLACTLALDLADHAMVSMLNRREVIEAVVMPHAALGQALWTSDLAGRRFTSHFVWYSSNSTPLAHISDPVTADYAGFRQIRADVSWVWTEQFAEYLKRLGVAGAMKVVGPILWYLPDGAEAPPGDDSIRIAVFDVVPVKPELEPALGIVHENYYRLERVVDFVEDVLAACHALEERTGRRVLVSLKPKRDGDVIHDPRYAAFIEEVNRSRPRVVVVPPETNVFSLIAASDAVIVIPYSSPAYVASHLGKPAIYYDPTEELFPTYEPDPLVTFAAGREGLIETLLAAVGKAGERALIGEAGEKRLATGGRVTVARDSR